MKAISLWQPWAALWIAPNAKIHETRSWPTKHRGELAVHAAKHPEEPLLPSAAMCAADILRDRLPLAYGAVIGVIDLIDCLPTSAGPASQADQLFGNWSPGRFAWMRGPFIYVLENPVACRGYQGIWTLDSDAESRIREQM